MSGFWAIMRKNCLPWAWSTLWASSANSITVTATTNFCCVPPCRSTGRKGRSVLQGKSPKAPWFISPAVTEPPSWRPRKRPFRWPSKTWETPRNHPWFFSIPAWPERPSWGCVRKKKSSESALNSTRPCRSWDSILTVNIAGVRGKLSDHF